MVLTRRKNVCRLHQNGPENGDGRKTSRAANSAKQKVKQKEESEKDNPIARLKVLYVKLKYCFVVVDVVVFIPTRLIVSWYKK